MRQLCSIQMIKYDALRLKHSQQCHANFSSCQLRPPRPRVETVWMQYGRTDLNDVVLSGPQFMSWYNLVFVRTSYYNGSGSVHLFDSIGYMKTVKMNCLKLIFIVAFTSLMISGLMAESLQDESKTSKILNGAETNISKWPWMAGLIRVGFDVFNGQFCGATLISDRWVLTAAHCVIDETTATIKILAGHTRLSDATDNDLLSISQIIIHPAFNQITLDSDLALLELSEVTTLTPIQMLGRHSLNDSPGLTAIALGWGDTSSVTFAFPDTLQAVDLPLVSNHLCAERASFFTDNMLCAGFSSGIKDTCSGDSGGPLVVFDEMSQLWHQVGITSFGVGCEAQGNFGGYTRVKNFSDFISAAICSNSESPEAPVMDMQVLGRNVTISWTSTTDIGGYRLNYAPYPDASPIESIDMHNQSHFSITLSSGNAFFVAINAYEGNCRSGLSNIGHFIIN